MESLNNYLNSDNSQVPFDHQAFAAVDDALRTYPIEPAPEVLLPAIMARVQALPRLSQPLPRFRLTWLDYAFSLFFSGMVTLVLLFYSLSPLSLLWRVHIQIQMEVWWLRLRYAPPELILTALASLVLPIALITVAALAFDRDRKSYHHGYN
jgi:hypothetical protein